METFAAFTGSIPAYYDQLMGPVIFEPYGEALAQEARMVRDGHVLECASGTGRVTRHLLAKLPPEGALLATDLNEDMLAIAEGRMSDPRLRFQVADMMALPFPDESFDTVVCGFGVMFLPDKPAGFAELARVLKPGGQLAYTVWGPLPANETMNELQSLLQETFPDDPPNFLHVPFGMSDEGMNRALVEGSGLENFVWKEVRKTMAPENPAALAEGMLKGGPLAGALAERGYKDVTDLQAELVRRFETRFGLNPMRAPMAASIVTADKPL